jgi:arylsulfatase A-like enzyme
MNIVVFCSDTFRYDHLGFTGLQPVQTPNLDRLSRESANFTDFRLCSFPTVLNRIEVFTGRYTFPLMGWGPLPYHFPALAQVFKHHGFATALVADNPHMMKDGFGFGRGFDFVKDVPGQTDDAFMPESAPMIDLPCAVEKLEPRHGRLERYRRNACWYRQQGTSTTETVCREAMRWIDGAPDKFFLWIDCFDPHEPWDAPARYLEPYPWDKSGETVIWPRDGRADAYPEADLANMRSLYKAEVSQIDHWVGELLVRLRERKKLDNTAVLFCSDHGYYFGEHGLLGKLFKRESGLVNTIYEELAHVPLLVRHPAGTGAGRSIPGFCQPTDLFPTVLELAGLPAVSWTHGHSLVQRLHGQPGNQKFAVGGCHPHSRNASCISLWSEEWSLIYSPVKGLAGSELYHRPTDPCQTKNVLADHGAIADQQFALLRSWLEGLGVSSSRLRHLLHYQRAGRTEKIKQRLWMLGNRLHYLRRYRHYA